MFRRSMVAAACMLAAGGPAAAAETGPIKVTPWHVTEGFDMSIDDAGRGVVVFPHGDHVWMASISPAGKIVRVARIPSPFTGADTIFSAQTPDGEVLAGFYEYPDVPEGDRGPLGRQPWVSRFGWGAPPARATWFSRGDGDSEGLRAAMRADGTAVLAWQQSPLDQDETQWIAMLPRGGAPTVRQVRVPGAIPDGVYATAGGEFAVGWIVGSRRHAITRIAADGSIAATEPVPGANDGPVQARVLANAAGDHAAVWQDVPRAGTPRVRVAFRRAGATRFSTQTVARGRDRYADAAFGPDGTVAILVRSSSPARARLVLRRRDRRVDGPIALPGRATGPRFAGEDNDFAFARHQQSLAVAADGSALVAYDVARGRHGRTARALRVTPSGRRRDVTSVPGCSLLGLVGNPAAAGLLAVVCPRPYAKLPAEREGGSLVAIARP